jgi:hypothetical protein
MVVTGLRPEKKILQLQKSDHIGRIQMLAIEQNYCNK